MSTIYLSNATFIMGQNNSIQQPPLPTLTLHLANADGRIFRPGEIIKGVVSLIPVKPLNPFALEVSLFGRSLIWYRIDTGGQNRSDYRHYRDNAPLLDIAYDILPNEQPEASRNNSGYLNPGRTYTYPFELPVPTGTEESRIHQYKHDGAQNWVVFPHKLPPSFLYTSRKGTDTTPNYAKIEYGIKARLSCPEVYVVKGKQKLDLTATAPINFQPHNPHLQEILTSSPQLTLLPKTFTLQSSILNGQYTDLNFSQSVRDRFSSHTPKLTFTLTTSLPTLLLIGSEFRFLVSFAVLSKSENATHIPPLTFRVIKLGLVEYTHVRAPQDLAATDTLAGRHRAPNKHIDMPAPNAQWTRKSRQHEVTEREKVGLNALPDKVTLELEEVPSYDDGAVMEQAKSAEVWFTARVPGGTMPGFRSFAISREYGIKVKVGVEIGGKEFVGEGEVKVEGLGGAE